MTKLLGKRASKIKNEDGPKEPATKIQKTDKGIQKKVNAAKPGSIDLMLAETIEKVNQNPKGWLMSEKLDGVRCYWDGTSMYTRNHKPFYPPDWFVAELPKDLALDGELWTKRDDF